LNADRARPLLAFWALAVVAGVITTMGLRAGSTRVEVPAGVPSPVTGTRSPELVLGGLLQAQPSATGTQGILSDVWTSASALEHALGLTSAREAGRPTSHSTVAGPKAGVPTDSSAVASARASAGPSGRGNSQGHGTSTATATAKPTHPSHGNGDDNGNGEGNGKGNAPTSPPGKTAKP
jgi:hypothetical protein